MTALWGCDRMKTKNRDNLLFFSYTRILLATTLFFSSSSLSAKCIDINEALKHVGETRCIVGKVFRVQQGNKGVHYLDFCEDYRSCTFTVVIFSSDLRHVGDVRPLQGRMVEVHGDVKEYEGRAEIILSDASQLGGDAVRIPPLPKNYDVEQKGHYGAGKFSHPKAARTTNKKRQTATLPDAIPKDTGAVEDASTSD
jgi:hypothetical protein